MFLFKQKLNCTTTHSSSFVSYVWRTDMKEELWGNVLHVCSPCLALWHVTLSRAVHVSLHVSLSNKVRCNTEDWVSGTRSLLEQEGAKAERCPRVKFLSPVSAHHVDCTSSDPFAADIKAFLSDRCRRAAPSCVFGWIWGPRPSSRKCHPHHCSSFSPDYPLDRGQQQSHSQRSLRLN